jgi:hypothetical protein
LYPAWTDIGESKKKAQTTQKTSGVSKYFMMAWAWPFQRVGEMFVWRKGPLSIEKDEGGVPSPDSPQDHERSWLYQLFLKLPKR